MALFPRQCLLIIAAFYTAGLAMRSPAARMKENEVEEQDPLIVRAVRHVSYQGQSQRPSFPGTNNGHCDCQYHVACASQLDKIEQSCKLPGGGSGICCPSTQGPAIHKRSTTTRGRQRGLRASVFRQHKPPKADSSRDVNLNMVNSACEKGKKDMMQYTEIEKLLLRKKIVLKRGTPASNHLRVFKKGPHTAQKDMDALTIAMATSHMKTSAPLRDCTTSGKLEVKTSILRNMCPVMPKCSNPNSKYRTADGSCNNIKNPDWGMSETPLARLLPPKYEDCIRSPRNTSVKGGPLPLPRTLSSNILIDNNKPDSQFTLSVMQWGQFMDHDLSLTPFEAMEHEGGEEGIRCCTEGNKEMLPESEQHPMCFPIEIPEGDGFFAPRKQRCMNFVRSQLAPGFDCRFGPVEQVNDLTHWIDASTVYGQNQHDQDRVRTKQNGTLKTSGNNSLPIDNDAFECDAPNRGGVCYLAGESRVNEQPILAVLHTVWMRQHNHIARQLKDINSQWSDEAVFQETRRIVAAQFQHITYNEWLPVIVGEPFMTEFKLSPQRSGFSSDYDPSTNANINNEFSTAAFRFGHSLVQGIFNLISAQGSASTARLRDNFMSAHLLIRPGLFDNFIRGLTRQPIQTFDNFVTQELSNHLFQTPQQDFGMDLMSLNIQRGRDHAIGTYNEARELCGLGKATSFKDLAKNNNMPASTVSRLEKLYASVDDIDLFIGGMSENSVFGGILGPTFICIVGDQFARLRKGDRYFYELGGQAGSFTKEQLQEIRLTSWARILCDNSDDIDSIQPLAFRLPKDRNKMVKCNSSSIPQINLNHWKGEKPQV